MRTLLIEDAIFLAGFLIQVLNSSNNAVKAGVYKSFRPWFTKNWEVVIIRFSLAVAVWTAYATNTALVTEWLGKVGISFALALPVTKTTSFFFGYAADSLLDLISNKVPWLQHYLPLPEMMAKNQTGDGK